MKGNMIVFALISVFAGVTCYIATDNIFISIGEFAIFLAVSIFLLSPKLKKYSVEKNKFRECYHFINNFIISLSIKKSIAGALETTSSSMNPEFLEMYGSLENMSENEKLDYLASYFSFHDYYLFLQIVNLWQEQGGDIIAMSKYLSNNLRSNEGYLTKVDSITKRKYFEIGVLWIITLAIIIFLRFALKDFYLKIKTQIVFLIAISAIILFALLTMYLLVSRGTHLDLKGNRQDEKNA